MVVERVSGSRAVQRSSARTDARKLRDGIFSAADQPSPLEHGRGVSDRRAEAIITARFESDDPEKLVDEIASLWTRAQGQFLAIGKNLIDARNLIARKLQDDPTVQAMRPADRRTVAESEWRKFLARLPFTQGIASQLEQVARALEGGRLVREELPSNYSVAYQLTTLSEAELEAARRREGIVGPSATRARIIDFKRQLREARTTRVALIEQRREKLLEAIARMQRDLDDVDRELSIAISENGSH